MPTNTTTTEDTMHGLTTTRHCYWTGATRQEHLTLTGPEHAHLSDDELRAEASAELARSGGEMGDGELRIAE